VEVTRAGLAGGKTALADFGKTFMENGSLYEIRE
jgi:hypothetical protein